MATRQGIDTAISTRLAETHQQLFLAVKGEFDTEDILLWSGNDDLVLNSETYTGVGTLLTISNVEDTREVKSSNISISLSAMDSTVLDYALTETYQNRPLTVFLGFLMGGSNEAAGVMTIFKGRMTNLSIIDDPNGSTVTVDGENRLIDLERPSNYRYTAESQEFLHSGDTGFNRIQQLQDKQITWGQQSDTVTGGGGGGYAGDGNPEYNLR
tara:strand:- start:5 stop:640 length:636 start_codon:yes stop_codon:yes gene_type:complete